MVDSPEAVPTLLHDLLDRAATNPDAVALTRAGRSWTYRELAAWSTGAARWFAERGIERGDRVVIVAPNEAETVAAVFGLSRLGAVFVIVSDRVPPFHLRHILLDSGARLVLTDTERPELARLADVPVHLLAEPFTDVSAYAPTGPRCLSVDLVCLIYTSGSTGMPKAVASTHAQVLFAVAAIARRLGYQAEDSVFCCLPLSFDYGLYQIFLACVAGCRVILGDDSDAGPALLRRLVEERSTVLPAVPSLVGTLCRLVVRSGTAPPLRMVTNTGADLPASQCAELRQQVPGVRVFAMFGLTECKRVTIAEPDLDLTRAGSVGRPLDGTEILIVDESGRSVPPGTVGELVVRGPHVMAGYWNAPELTARRFHRDHLGRTALFTGDRARVDADGYLYFLGRDDDLYKQHGQRISTIEIETAALDIPHVELAAALPARDGRQARLAVTGRIDHAALLAGLRQRLDARRVPPDCRVVGALPLGATGKVDKRALAEGWDRAAAQYVTTVS